MTERETAGRLNELRTPIYNESGYFGSDNLEDAVVAALNIDRPPGHPDEYDDASESLGRAAVNVDNALHAVKKLRTMVLPAAWSGEASVSAGAALKALERMFERTGDVFAEAKKVFADQGQNLAEAHRTDKRGIGSLEYAREKLRGNTGVFSYDEDAVNAARGPAISGIDDRTRAANSARDTAERTASTLKDLAGAARVSQLSGSSMDPLSELLIADAGGSGDADELILTPVMAERARQAIDRLSPDDRARLDLLLSQAKSPDEQAYIMKALGAGYGMHEVEKFDQMIHAHGDDPAWLKDRLSPLDNTDSKGDAPGAQIVPGSHGQPWWQGMGNPTCVASSNVMARVQVDPIYALELTTGGHPDDPAYDNPAAFTQRMHAEQHRVDVEGADPEGHHPPDQSAQMANEQVGSHTGVTYADQETHDADARREALRKAEEAVDRGVPVPFNTQTHEMVIIGHDGDMIQVYNPWGYTVWMKEEDFINGNLNALGQKEPPVNMRLPK